MRRLGSDSQLTVYSKTENALTLKQAALATGLIDEKIFDEIVDPQKMAFPS
jgi:fumarate hydratase class II